ncbi:MAG TPA: DUF6265 family protein [Bacteroidia bacterium]|nr:DUF6265 family protein [Bacteroidia bacterium]
MKKTILILFSCLLLFSCNTKPSLEEESDMCKDYSPNAIEQANWFIGSWQNRSNDGLFKEVWKYMNDSLYKGESYILQNNDTVFYESIDIEKQNNEWCYTVSVKGQNKEEPVSFKLTSLSPNQLVFENPTHDFPTKITYLKISDDSIVASISGLIAGKEKIEQFPMKKVK